MKWVPRPEQELMLRHLRTVHRGRALHAGCGTGKTAVTGTWLLESMYDRFDTRRWLIVAPKAVAEDTWARDFAKWDHLADLQPRLIDFTDLGLTKAPAGKTTGGLEFRNRSAAKRHLRALPGCVHVTAYHTFPWIVKATGANFPYDGIVFDESAFLREHTSQRYRAAKHACRSLGLVNEVIELGGTPIPKTYEDLFTQFVLLDGGARLGYTLTEFRDKWMEPDARGQAGVVYSWKLRAGQLQGIQQRIGELAISVDHDTGVELIESEQFIELSPAARKAYNEMRRDLITEIGDATVISPNAAVLVGKLLQICNGHVFDAAGVSRPIDSAKLDAVCEAVEAAASPVLLAYPYVADENALVKRLGARMRLAKEPGAIQAFREGTISVLGFHPGTLSHGVDGLQGASNTVFWFGPTHRWDWYHQVYKRLQRVGQKKSKVFVRTFVAEQTLELGIINNVLRPRGQRNHGLLEAIRAH